MSLFNRNRRSSTMETSDSCLDLSLHGCWVIVYYPVCDPGNEYDILSEKDLVDNWDVLQRGVQVAVKFGNARVQGLVVAVSDDYNYLKTNFACLTEQHQETVNKRNRKMSTNGKVADKQTQTDNNEPIENRTLSEKYEKLQSEYQKMTALFSEIKCDLEQTAQKFNIQSTISTEENVLKSVQVTQAARNASKMVQIGSKGTQVAQTVLDSVNWMSYTAATRKLLITLFPRKILATHSLTGKPSPAFQTRETKMRLNPTIIADIVEIISRKCKVSESLVRGAITTKCADENKLYRRRMEKRRASDVENCL